MTQSSSHNPPLLHHYTHLLNQFQSPGLGSGSVETKECELPLVNLRFGSVRSSSVCSFNNLLNHLERPGSGSGSRSGLGLGSGSAEMEESELPLERPGSGSGSGCAKMEGSGSGLGSGSVEMEESELPLERPGSGSGCAEMEGSGSVEMEESELPLERPGSGSGCAKNEGSGSGLGSGSAEMEESELPLERPGSGSGSGLGSGSVEMEECELPLVDLRGLWSEDEEERASCASEICKASGEWGFFQIVNHGISLELLRKMRMEQVKLFKAPFERKAASGLLDNSYRWGNRTATCLKQLSWCEAFHVPLTKISDDACYCEFSSLRKVMQEYASAMQELAKSIASVLVTNMGVRRGAWEDNCNASTCFLRLNRYPPCPISPEVLGLVPHTDSDFLTILHQDEHVGGLQLMKDSKWVAVKPNRDALVVNIGDLFQAWSNDVYKSVEHKVMVNREAERHSIAYFLCPSYESFIGCCKEESSIYKRFTFGEYRSRIQEDVKAYGHKVGLPRFIVST